MRGPPLLGLRQTSRIWRATTIGVAVLLASTVAGGAEASGCPLQTVEEFGYNLSSSNGVITVGYHAAAPGATKPGPFITFQGVVERLARDAGAVAVFVGGPVNSNRSHLRADGTWTGGSELDALRNLLSALGQEVRVQDRYWLVGTAEELDTSAVIISIGPIAGNALPERVEDALLRDLPVHHFQDTYNFVARDAPHHTAYSLYPIRVGYVLAPEDPNEVIVFAGTGDGLAESRAFRARLSAGTEISAECLWGEWSGGDPIPAFTEDLDRDGVRDLVIDRRHQEYSSRDEMVPSAVLSGRTGEILFSFFASCLAVEHSPAGRVRVAARTRESDLAEEPCVPVFQIASGGTGLVQVHGLPEPARLTPSCFNPVARLAATGEDSADIVLYDLMPERPYGQHVCPRTGRESRSVAGAPTWSFAFRISADLQVEDNTGSRVALEYTPPGYREAYRRYRR